MLKEFLRMGEIMTRECRNLVEYRYLKDDSPFIVIKAKNLNYQNHQTVRCEEFKSRHVRMEIYTDLEIWCQEYIR